MAKGSGGGISGYAKRHGFKISSIPRNQTRLREQYKYVVTGGPGRGGRMYASNLRGASALMRGSVNAGRRWRKMIA